MDEDTKFKIKNIGLAIFLFVIIITLTFRVAVEQHELVHVKICKYFGGEPTLNMEWHGLSGSVKCNDVNPEKEQMRLFADSMNEAFMYQLHPIIVMIALFAIMGCILLLSIMHRLD